MVEAVRRTGATPSVVSAGRLRQPWKMATAVRSIARLAREREANVVLGWMGKAHLYGGPAARLAGVPAVWFQHALPGDPPGWLDRLAGRISTCGILTCSAFVAEAQRRVTPDADIRVCHPPAAMAGSDLANVSASKGRAALGVPEGAPLVGIAARLQRWKGIHVLLDAMRSILERHPEARLVVVGGSWPLEPGHEGELRAQSKRLGLADRVIFAGHRTDVANCMAAFDVAVHASDREPFGMVIVEAMALGRPVVAAAEGGPREIVTDGVDGLLVPHGDVGGLAFAVNRLLGDPVLAARLGAAARERAADFTVERFATSVEGALLELTAGEGHS